MTVVLRELEIEWEWDVEFDIADKLGWGNELNSCEWHCYIEESCDGDVEIVDENW